MRTITKRMIISIVAVCMALLPAGLEVSAEPVYEAAAGVDIQIYLTGLEKPDYEVGTVVPAELEAVLMVQDQQSGIASVFYSIEADGQGWNYQVSVSEAGEYETSPDPSAGYDNVQQGWLEEWNILEAEGDMIHCMSRTIYIYAQYNATIRLAFVDRMGNLYSYQEDYVVGTPEWEQEPVPEGTEADMEELLPEEYLQDDQGFDADPGDLPEGEYLPEDIEDGVDDDTDDGLLPEGEYLPEDIEGGVDDGTDDGSLPEDEYLPEDIEDHFEEEALLSAEYLPEESGNSIEQEQEGLPEETELDREAHPEEELPEEELPEETLSEEGLSEEILPEDQDEQIEETLTEEIEEVVEEPEAFDAGESPEEGPEEDIPLEAVPEVQETTPSEAQEVAITETGAAEEPEVLPLSAPEETPETLTVTETVAETVQAEQPGQTWSSYSGTPSYYYPQSSAGGSAVGYSGAANNGTRSGTSSYSTYSSSAGRGSLAVSTGSDSFSGKDPAASDEEVTLSTEEQEAEKEIDTEKDPDTDTKSEEDLKPEGSVYDLSAIEKYNGKYLKTVENLVIYESNSNKIDPESVKVLISRNGEMIELEKDVDFSFKLTGSSADQKIYKYTIEQNVFRTDGAYRVFLLSEDEDGNQNSSESKDAAIWFHIDNVNPLILSVESTKEQETQGYREIRIKDDTQLSDIEIYLGDHKVEFEEDGETYRFPVSRDNEDADVKVVAKDQAGNSYERVLRNYVQAGKAKVRAGVSPVPVIILAAAGVLTAVYVFRKRKKARRSYKTR